SKTYETTSGSAQGGFNLNDEAVESEEETQKERPIGRGRAKKKSSASSREGSSFIFGSRQILQHFFILKMASFLPLIEELTRAAGSDVTKEQLGVLIKREVDKSVGKIEEFRRLCIELRANIRLRNDYISELMLYRSCDDTLGSIAMLRTMQLYDTENVARLLSLARETQRKVDEKNAFIRRIMERIPRTPL
ncbi:hypothetical protein Tco_1141529, partial [Tanacetum coccineum]